MTIRSINPHDQSVVGETPVSTPQDVENAVAKARKAFPKWKNTPITERVKYLQVFKQKLLDHQDEIARLTSLEMGKPWQQAKDEVPSEVAFVDYYATEGPKNLADETVLKQGTEHYRAVFEPFGVTAVISPWNFPLSMMTSGVLPAIVAGNTVVFKPSEYTTLTQKFTLELLQQTGIPEGVVNLVVGAGDVGSSLVDQPVDLVWFTGSTKVGQEIYAKCGQKFIKCLAEMGGSSAGIIFADANLELTLDQLYWARFLNCGQVCSSVKRLFIEKPAYDKVLQQYVDRLKKVKIGNPLDKDVDLGPLVNQKQLKKLEEQVADAIKKRAKVEIGGKMPAESSLAKGNYFEPTILTNVNLDMSVMHEEVFGPVLPVMPFSSVEEVVTLANKTEYGLTSEIYTSDMAKAEKIATDLDSGVVAINTDNFYKPFCPIGGYKKSGIGREYGKIGMQEFAQVKLIAVNNP